MNHRGRTHRGRTHRGRTHRGRTHSFEKGNSWSRVEIEADAVEKVPRTPCLSSYNDSNLSVRSCVSELVNLISLLVIVMKGTTMST